MNGKMDGRIDAYLLEQINECIANQLYGMDEWLVDCVDGLLLAGCLNNWKGGEINQLLGTWHVNQEDKSETVFVSRE